MENDDGPSVTELVQAASDGDQEAWESLVKRYLPLITCVGLRYRVSDDDMADISQTVWIQLVQHLPEIRTPAALPGWIVTTTRNECFKVLKAGRRTIPVDSLMDQFSPVTGRTRAEEPDFDEFLVREERHAALLTAFAELSDQHRSLLALLVVDPPLSYEEISARLDMPIGGIGPTRARALDRLRRSPALAALMSGNLTEDTTKRTGK